MAASDEVVTIVDREDNIVDEVPRHVMRSRAMRHRVTYILVFDSSGRLFVQKRTPTKDLYPGYFDLAAGGVVCAGESYEESARREAHEELGLGDAPLVPRFKFHFEREDNKSWGMVYSCTHDGPFELQPEEVESGDFVDIDTVLGGGITPVTPDTMAVLKRFLGAESPTGDPWLLTPGPLTTSPSVKQAMLHDYGSRDRTFIDINARVRERLVDIIDGADSHVCVPLQGSGTFVVEAMIGSFVPAGGKLLILVNGAYGHRMAKICTYLRREHLVLEVPEDRPVDVSQLDRTLASDQGIGHVAVVHCETTSGILNPIDQVSEVVSRHGRRLLIDAMSAFGAIPLSARDTEFDAVVASSNKCLEGSPGMGFCLAERSALEATRGNSHSLCMDLYDQWVSMEKNGQWRFTPPTHAILALSQALDEFEEEGGVEGRGGRYRENCRVLVEGMRAQGFRTLLPDELQAPIIVTFHMPEDPKFDFNRFYDLLGDRGFVIYPGKLTVADSFRIGCIGRIGVEQMRGALAAVKSAMAEFG